MRNLSWCVWLTAACAALVVVRPAGARAAQEYTTVEVATGLNSPVFVTGAPGDYRRVFVVSRKGRVQVLDTSLVPYALQSAAAPFLNIAGLLPVGENEWGLLGLAFHPKFQANGKLYVYYTARPVPGLPSSIRYYCTVAEYTVRDPRSGVANPSLEYADPASARILMQIPHPQTEHNGGWIGFGPDGYLYVAVGDGGSSGDAGVGHNPTIGNAQDTGTALGKLLRIDVDVTGEPAQGPFVPGTIASYGIPADNPTIPAPSGSTGSRREIWAYGLRNPYRNSFDRLTGDLYIADVGQSLWEEINFQPALTPDNVAEVGGRNYGWRCREGVEPFNANGGACAGQSFTEPAAVYTHGQFVDNPPAQLVAELNNGCAVIGGYVYRGCAIPTLKGKYVVMDFCSGGVIALSTQGGVLAGAVEMPAPRGSSTQVSFGEDSYGELYFCEHVLGRVLKYVPVAGGQPSLRNCDIDRNGVVTLNDLFQFLPMWFGRSIGADINGNPQSPAGVTVQDVFDFMDCFVGWCRG